MLQMHTTIIDRLLCAQYTEQKLPSVCLSHI